MSSKTTILPGKARRESGKTGRFLPSEPLHMTTRRAKRTGRVSDGSNNDSNEGEESPQGSFDDAHPTTSRSLGSQTSSKGRRISVNSANGASDVKFTFEPRSSDSKRRRSSETKPESPGLPSGSPSRKRKRSSPTPSEARNASAEVFTPPSNALPYPYDGKLDEDVRPGDGSSREFSEASSPLNGQQPAEYLNVTQSTEFTPAVSEAASPATATYDEVDISPTKDTIMTGIEPEADADEQDEVDDADDLAEADDADDVEEGNDAEDGDENSRTYDGQSRKRIHGRRRADHPEPSIEATMRRQLQLKSAFRAITRALKPVLAEIALKTVEDLQAKPDLHELVPEYTGTDEYYGIQELLDQAYQKRKNQITAQARWNRLHLQKTLEAERTAREAKCRLLIEDLRDLEVDRLEHKSLSIARRAQLTEEDSSYETQDEDDDVLLQPKATTYRFARTQAMGIQYDSRSRQALAAEQASNELSARVRLTDMLRELPEEDQREVFGSFTTMDPRAREAANARLAGIHTTIALADAAAKIEEIANRPVIPVIRNEEATGLQLLGDLASRPSIRAVEPPKIAQTHRHDPFWGGNLTAGMQMPPPPPVRPAVALERLLDEIAPTHAGIPTAEPYNAFANPIAPTRKSSLPVSNSAQPLQSPRADATRAGTLPPMLKPIDPDVTRHSLPLQHTRGGSFDHILNRSDPLRAVTQPRDTPTWDNYQRPNDRVKRSRNISTGDRSIHEWSHGGPLRIERVGQTEPDSRAPSEAAGLAQSEPANEQPPPKKDSPSDVLLHTSKAKQPEKPASPGAAEPPRPQEKASLEPHKDAASETPIIKPRSRASSIKSQSTTRDFTPDATTSAGDAAQFHHRQQKGSMSTWSLKTNKKERNGSSRKSWKEQLGGNGRRTSQGSPNTDGKPSIHRFRLNTSVEATPTTTTWAAPSPQYMMDYHHMPFAGYPSPWHPGVGPPPPPGYPYMHGFHPYYEHRNSFPPPPPGTGPPPGHPNWPPHSQGPPPYGPPHSTPTPTGPSQPPPPPPGVSPADWQHHQSIYGGGTPLNPARDPRGAMPPVSASYTAQQYGGQTLAPASAAPPPPPANPNLDPRLSFAGPGPTTPGQGGQGQSGQQQHLPAFAQVRDGEGGGGSAGGSGSGSGGGGKGRSGSGTGGSRRKRAQSDVPGQARFQHWRPRQ